MLEELTLQLDDGQNLAEEQVYAATGELASESVPAEPKAAFMIALARKGETPDEIAWFARALRDRSLTPPLDNETRSRVILDVVGTGGDRARTFNISTGAALLSAACGVTVAKHGNRAVTSQTGSADVLEALGIRIDLSPSEAALAMRTHGFAFFFAPRYHPAFKHIGPARRLCAEQGKRTVFNYLGPLLNPAKPTAQIMGVPRVDLCEPMARVLQSLGVRRGMVVCGKVECTTAIDPGNTAPGMAVWIDELSTLGPTTVAEFYEGSDVHLSELVPALFNVQSAGLVDLQGGCRDENAAILRRLITGEDRGPRRDALLLNAGAALFMAGRVRTISEGWECAAAQIDSGAAASKLAALCTARVL